MSLIVKEEKLTDSLITELEPILVAHYQELSNNIDIPLNPDYDKYKKLYEAGCLVIVTARSGGLLVGYTCFLISPNMHYKTSLQAYQDAMFVRQDKRKTMLGAGIALLRESEKVLKARGVQLIQHHVKVYKDFSPMLERLGYSFVEKIYQKRLY